MIRQCVVASYQLCGFHRSEEESGEIGSGFGWFVIPSKVDLLKDEAVHHAEKAFRRHSRIGFAKFSTSDPFLDDSGED